MSEQPLTLAGSFMDLDAPIQLRRGTAAFWAAADAAGSGVILAAGEPALETDTGLQKIGDGVSRWSQLRYSVVALSQVGKSGGPATLDSASQLTAVQWPILVQSGSVLVTSTTAAGVVVPVAYPKPFTVEPGVILNIRSKADTATMRVASAGSTTKTGFGLFFARIDTTATTVDWCAVGYG